MSVCLMLDVDGVLVSGRPSDGRFWTHSLFRDLGINPEHLVQQFFALDWQDVVTGKSDLHSTLSLSLKRMSSSVTAEELISYWFEMDSRLVQSVLTDCRMARDWGCQVYLATNQEHLRAKYLMEILGLKNEVDGIIYSANAGYQKPHSKFFGYAVDMTGREPSEMLLVDDTQANVDGARNAGWNAVHWDGKQRLSDILRHNIDQ
ncbi:MAG: HAD-IA family hydrolase [Aliishimia sp.]